MGFAWSPRYAPISIRTRRRNLLVAAGYGHFRQVARACTLASMHPPQHNPALASNLFADLTAEERAEVERKILGYLEIMMSIALKNDGLTSPHEGRTLIS